MYLNKNKHILSKTILCVAIVNALAEAVYSITRAGIMRTGNTRYPEVMNNWIMEADIVIFLIKLLVNAFLFWRSQNKINAIHKLIPAEDMEEIRLLQKAYIPDKISTLDIGTTEMLLKIWALIILGISMVYEITSVIYNAFIVRLFLGVGIDSPDKVRLLTSIYNETHGFKYIGMVIAIFIGIVITAICLKDQMMMLISAEVIVAFLITFLLLGQSQMVIMSKHVGVVWTSVIFHAIQTFGLLSLGIYLKLKYKGI